LVGSATAHSSNYRRVPRWSTRLVPWRGYAGGSASAEGSHLVDQYRPRWSVGQRVTRAPPSQERRLVGGPSRVPRVLGDGAWCVRAAPSLTQVRRSGRCVGRGGVAVRGALVRSCPHALGETVAGVILHGSLTGRLGPGAPRRRPAGHRRGSTERGAAGCPERGCEQALAAGDGRRMSITPRSPRPGLAIPGPVRG
jgi:hypothetical protein